MAGCNGTASIMASVQTFTLWWGMFCLCPPGGGLCGVLGPNTNRGPQGSHGEEAITIREGTTYGTHCTHDTHNVPRTTHYTLHKIHSRLYTHYTIHNPLYTTQNTQHVTLDYTLNTHYTINNALYTTQNTLYTVNYQQNTLTLHTTQNTLYSTQ